MSALAPAAEDVLSWAYKTFPRLVLVASFQAESSVLIEMTSRIRPDAKVLTLDTGRLPQQTYDMIDRVRDRYGIEVQVVSPDAADVEDMVGRHGANLFRHSPAMRRLCCEVRKSRPLARRPGRVRRLITGVSGAGADARNDRGRRGLIPSTKG
jgi:3'-phosphoadenosine 5'-phosphosulfate sulfotransferase (PAPS reductase)/FAD synthetase